MRKVTDGFYILGEIKSREERGGGAEVGGKKRRWKTVLLEGSKPGWGSRRLPVGPKYYLSLWAGI